MAEAPFASRLRYLDAADVDDSVVDFDGLAVRGRDDEKLGDVDGFILDVGSGRVLYAVIDSSGWFTSRRFLLPIGHAPIVDRSNDVLHVDLPRAALEKYPRFDESRFQELSDDDLRAFAVATSAACCTDEPVESPSAWPFDTARHYEQPSWWDPDTYAPDRLRPVANGIGTSRGAPADRRRRERRGSNGGRVLPQPPRSPAGARPSVDDRARPGDVLGTETGGERTSVGETAEVETERRRSAERTAAREPNEGNGARR